MNGAGRLDVLVFVSQMKHYCKLLYYFLDVVCRLCLFLKVTGCLCLNIYIFT